MACETLLEVVDDCLNNIGGSNEIVYNDQSEVSVAAIVIDPITGVITAMTSTTPFKKIAFKKNAANFVESEKIDLDAGSNYIEGTLTISLKRRDSVKSKMIKAAAQGQRKLAFIVKDGNGIFWYLQNMQLTANEGGTGENKAAGSKYDLTFMGEYEFMANEIEKTVVAGLLI